MDPKQNGIRRKLPFHLYLNEVDGFWEVPLWLQLFVSQLDTELPPDGFDSFESMCAWLRRIDTQERSRAVERCTQLGVTRPLSTKMLDTVS